MTPPLSARLPLLPDFEERTRDFTGRQWVLQEIDRWLAEPTPRFLVTGRPGTGKSAIAARLVQLSNGDILDDELPRLRPGFLAYAHFCQFRNYPTLNPLTFVQDLSARLASLHEGFRRALLATDHREISITGRADVTTAAAGATVVGVNVAVHVHNLPPQAAFDEVVRKPLQTLGAGGLGRPITILVDALDEALTFKPVHLVELLRDILQAQNPLPGGLRFLLTARSQEARVLDRLGRADVDLATDIPLHVDDLHDYAQARLLELGEPARSTLARRVTEKRQGNFLYARYVLDDLLAHPERVVDPATVPLPEGLEGVYREFLTRELAPDRVDRDWRTRFRPVLGLLAVARGEGLRLPHIAAAARLRPSEAEDTLAACAQFLTGPRPEGPFRIYHHSFREFLLADPDFHVYAGEASEALAEHLLEEYAGDWDTCADAYALEHAPAHFVEAIEETKDSTNRRKLSTDLTRLLTDLSFLEAKTARFGVDATLTDLQRARKVLTAGVNEVDQALRVLNRETHNLRGWDPQANPPLFATQIRNRARELGVTFLAEEAGTRLHRLGRPHLELLWRAAAESPALERILVGHDGPVDTVAVTLGGRGLISGGRDGTLRIWDLPTGQQLLVLEDHPYGVAKVLASPDGRRAVSASRDRAAGVRIWDLESPQELLTLQDVNDIAMTPDGRLLAIALQSGNLQVRTPDTAGLLSELSGRGRSATVIAVDPVGRWVAAGSSTGDITVWDLDTGQARDLLAQAPVSAIALTRGGGLLVSGLSTGTVQVWDLTEDGDARILGDHEEGVVGLAVTDDAVTAVSASDDGTMTSWDLRTGDALNSVPADRAWLHGSGAPPIALTSDGRLAIGALGWQTLRIMEIRKGGQVRLLRGHGHLIRATAVTPDGRLAISASEDHTIRVWNLEASHLLPNLLGHANSIEAVAVSPDGDVALSGSTDGILKAWNVPGGEAQFSLRAHDGSIEAIAVDRSGRIAVSAGLDSTVRLWELREEKETRTVEVTATPGDLAIADDGTVVMASGHGALAVWDSHGVRTVRTGSDHRFELLPCAVAQGGRAAILAEPGTDIQFMTIFDLAMGVSQRLVTDSQAQSVAITFDGQVAAAGLPDGTVRVWAVKDGRELYKLVGHLYLVTSVVMTPDARRLVSGAGDRTLRVWDLVASQHEAAVELQAAAVVALDSEVSCVAASSEGLTIIAGDKSGAVSCFRLWDPPLW